MAKTILNFHFDYLNPSLIMVTSNCGVYKVLHVFGFLLGLFEILTPFLGTFSFGHFQTLLLKIYTPVLLVLPGQSLSVIVKRQCICNYQCKEQVGVGHFL